MADLRSTEQMEEHRDELKRVMGPGLLLLFIIGDILGTGIYALTGTVAKEVGGMVWLPFLLAFTVAVMTAFAYLELVTKYPQAGGAAVYTNKAFKIGFLTFMVAFTVMASGITSASTASRAFAENFMKGFGLESNGGLVTVIALCFIGTIMVTSFVSRYYRSRELRCGGFRVADPESKLLWDTIRHLELTVLVPHRPGRRSLPEKEASIRREHRIPRDLMVVFVEVNLADVSEFDPIVTISFDPVLRAFTGSATQAGALRRSPQPSLPPADGR